MTPTKMKKFTAVVLDTELDRVLRVFADLGVAHLVDYHLRSEELGEDLEPVEATERFYYVSNLLTRINTIISELKVIQGGRPKKPMEVPAAPDQEYLSGIEAELKEIESAYSDLKEKLDEATEANDKGAKKALKKEIKQLAQDQRPKLLAWREILEREHRIEEAKTLLGKTKRTYVMVGWIPAKEAGRFVQNVEKQCGESVALQITDYEEPVHLHGEEEGEVEGDRPPTKLTNPRQLKSYEDLTKAFGVPSHREIDPTLFMFVGFPIFFGLMFGDIGHGLLLLFFALLGMWAKRREIDIGELGNYFIQGSSLIALCAVSAIFFGVLYGEFLGLSITGTATYNLIRNSLLGVCMRAFLLGLFRFFDFDAGVHYFTHGHGSHWDEGAIWFSAFESPEETWLLFVLSIIIGVIHLSASISLDLANKIRRRQWKEAIFGPLVWLWFFISFAIIIFTKGINFMEWFTWNDPIQPNLTGTPIGDILLLLIAPLLVMMFGGIATAGPMEGFMEALEHLIASISNTISYARILALNMAHAGFAKTFLFMAGVSETTIEFVMLHVIGGPNFGTFIALLIGGTIFILLMEGLLSFIHTLRLHWVEAYLKFYSGTGYEYKPLILPYKWTTPSPKA